MNADPSAIDGELALTCDERTDGREHDAGFGGEHDGEAPVYGESELAARERTEPRSPELIGANLHRGRHAGEAGHASAHADAEGAAKV